VNNKYTSPEWNGFSFLMNQGSCNFQFSDSLTIPTAPGFIKIENLDDDPTPEIITQSADCRIRITFNDIASDTLRLNIGSHWVIYGVSIGDIDHNGYKDILFADCQSKRWGIFYNYGSRNFSSVHLFDVNYYPYATACGQLNNDSLTDIVIANQSTEIYWNTGNGFQKQTLETNSARNYVSILDLDYDGLNDVTAINNYLSFTNIQMYRNLGNNLFDTISGLNIQKGSYNSIIQDVNGDMLPDIILLLNDNTGYEIFFNLGAFQFGNPRFIAVPYLGEYERNFYCVDLDGNSSPDLITTRKAGNRILNINILYNDGHGNFTPTPYVGITLKILSDQTISAFPNPFSEETRIQFSLDNPANVNLSIYDLEGKLINCLINQYLKGGTHSIKWHRLDMTTKSCKPGAYIIYLTVNGQTCRSTKIIVY